MGSIDNLPHVAPFLPDTETAFLTDKEMDSTVPLESLLKAVPENKWSMVKSQLQNMDLLLGERVRLENLRERLETAPSTNFPATEKFIRKALESLKSNQQ